MRELELRAEKERILNDEVYARKALNLSEKDTDFIFQGYKDERIIELKRQIKKYEEWNKQKESGVPLRFQNCSFDNFECRTQADKKRKEEVISFIEKENNDGVLLMTGSKGTGKTHLGTAAIRATLGNYVIMEDFVYDVESSQNYKSDKTTAVLLKDYFTCRFLVIDEVGRSLKKNEEFALLGYILRRRYDNMLPTIVISNWDKNTLLSNLNSAVLDRMKEVATSIEFSGESYRILKRKIRKDA